VGFGKNPKVGRKKPGLQGSKESKGRSLKSRDRDTKNDRETPCDKGTKEPPRAWEGTEKGSNLIWVAT